MNEIRLSVIAAYFFTAFLLVACSSDAEVLSTKPGTATYLGNEGVMIEHADTKVLFDPFFHNTYNIYQVVPDDIRDALFSNQAPYDNIDAIFISHAHGDHFSPDDLVDFLLEHPNTKLIAPQQAINQVLELENFEDISSIKPRLHAIKLAYKDAPVELTLGSLKIDAVRIPHAGWPQRAGISNLVFRVTLNNAITVIHMGDADPNDEHFKPLISHWEKQKTNTAFPPYWFMTSENGQLILKERIKADNNIAIHVPVAVPKALSSLNENYFSTPSETTPVNP